MNSDREHDFNSSIPLLLLDLKKKKNLASEYFCDLISYTLQGTALGKEKLKSYDKEAFASNYQIIFC